MNQLFGDRHNFAINPFGCSFTVYGKPQPAGSKNPRFNRKTGKMFVHDQNPHLKQWQLEIGMIAGQLMKGRQLYTGPLELHATFYFTRPKGHYDSKGRLKRSAAKRPTVPPDLTKILRGLEDGLNEILWDDDKFVVTTFARKMYCPVDEEARTEVKVMVVM